MATVDINAIQNILNNAAKNETLVSEIRKAAGRVQKSLDDLNKLLADGYTPEVSAAKKRGTKAPKAIGEIDPHAPYGRKANGEPKGKPGRGAGKVGADSTGELDLASGGNVLTGRTADEADAPVPAAKKEKAK
jgi:hypothetical protein